eukprot:CAMPEP_0119306844 /NCGR_PEP_ID=MMETSP1333-20130426/7506_1 /TAXON_ID=418940 /ORGANISM="Scyphosphaera apsteinii, Strain RCC1455" /LENGTH=250 /DNA_ID=CAMNT_0007310261 /DNA_START=31 /DNA_END=783 /DNA_ORIENTATION=+
MSLKWLAFFIASATCSRIREPAGTKPTRLPIATHFHTAKLVPAWSGTALDLVAGSSIGAASGYLIGETLRVTVSSAVISTKLGVVAIAPFAVRAAIFGAITYFFEQFQLLSIQWGRILSPLKKLGAKIDQTNDGKFDGSDVHILKSRLFQTKYSRAILGFVDKNKNGKVDLDDVKLHAESNQHAAIGGAICFALGLARGLGALSAGPLKTPSPDPPIDGGGTIQEWLGLAARVCKAAFTGAKDGVAGALK